MVTAGARLPERGLVRRVASEPGLTISIVCILVYLFVVHSYKLNVGSAAVVIGLIALLLEGRTLRVPPFLLWFGGFLVWALVTLPFGIAPEASLDRWIDFSKLWLILAARWPVGSGNVSLSQPACRSHDARCCQDG